jgi:hypothetical protein
VVVDCPKMRQPLVDLEPYLWGMPALGWIALAVSVAVVTGQVVALWTKRRRRPKTAADHLKAARIAARAIRRDNARIKPNDPLHAPLHISDGAAHSGGV